MAQLTNSTADLEQAYRSAIYRVLADPPFDLAVDQFSPALKHWHAKTGATCSAVMTAANPGSTLLSECENERRHVQLMANVKGWISLQGENLDPEGRWPPERSVLIAGMNPSQAEKLASDWGQNAWLQMGRDATPKLMFAAD